MNYFIPGFLTFLLLTSISCVHPRFAQFYHTAQKQVTLQGSTIQRRKKLRNKITEILGKMNFILEKSTQIFQERCFYPIIGKRAVRCKNFGVLIKRYMLAQKSIIENQDLFLRTFVYNRSNVSK